ncbi:unnamed protein product [Cyclocybe aegerita]|uniref:Uncharacterized protein n=1 Tax=Cyclocybe aegerita TaxID=1973307 RepID=A0A8S0WDR8_CYCAE|nr:unnamed protein product [Cyclocybe aegerita]
MPSAVQLLSLRILPPSAHHMMFPSAILLNLSIPQTASPRDQTPSSKFSNSEHHPHKHARPASQAPGSSMISLWADAPMGPGDHDKSNSKLRESGLGGSDGGPRTGVALSSDSGWGNGEIAHSVGSWVLWTRPGGMTERGNPDSTARL